MTENTVKRQLQVVLKEIITILNFRNNFGKECWSDTEAVQNTGSEHELRNC